MDYKKRHKKCALGQVYGGGETSDGANGYV